MKLYLIIYFAGLIGGTVGPLSTEDGRLACAEAALEINTKAFDKKESVWAICEWRAVRPELETRQ